MLPHTPLECLFSIKQQYFHRYVYNTGVVTYADDDNNDHDDDVDDDNDDDDDETDNDDNCIQFVQRYYLRAYSMQIVFLNCCRHSNQYTFPSIQSFVA